MKHISKILSASLLCTTLLNASGYRIPEQSANAIALSAANIAANQSADASYYNPANMAFMEDKNHLEGNLNYIGLPKVNFEDSINKNPMSSSGKSLKEDFLVPTVFYVSPELAKNVKLGFAAVGPGGLSKRWETPYMKASAQEFSLKIIEANPTMSYKVNNEFALGFGLRAVYIDGKVKSDFLNPKMPKGPHLSRDLTGDSVDFGYNLALAYKPSDDLKLGLTYRSKVDLTVEGDAKLSSFTGNKYKGSADITIPLPAVLDLAIAKTFDKTTLEFVYEREFWSSYKELDFGYSRPLKDPYLKGAFDDAKPKDWKDVDVYRIGLTHQYNDKLKLMAGFAYDKTPVVEEHLGFELPDSDTFIYSAGFNYKVSDDMSVGLGYLYADKKDRKVKNKDINGEFKGNDAHLASMSFEYKF